MNRVCVIGRLTRDPELKTTTTGKFVTSFGIAVDKKVKPTDGSTTADFFNVTAWGQSAEFVANYLSKGRLVSIDGRLQSRKYTDKEGNNRDVVEIVAENVNGLDRPKDDAAPASKSKLAEDEYDPFVD